MDQIVKEWKSAHVSSNSSVKRMERKVKKEYAVSQRAWSMLYADDRRPVFNILQVSLHPY
jgi:hypothetical protein